MRIDELLFLGEWSTGTMTKDWIKGSSVFWIGKARRRSRKAQSGKTRKNKDRRTVSLRASDGARSRDSPQCTIVQGRAQLIERKGRATRVVRVLAWRGEVQGGLAVMMSLSGSGVVVVSDSRRIWQAGRSHDMCLQDGGEQIVLRVGSGRASSRLRRRNMETRI